MVWHIENVAKFKKLPPEYKIVKIEKVIKIGCFKGKNARFCNFVLKILLDNC